MLGSLVHVFYQQGIDEDSKLHLSEHQLESLLQYILREAALHCQEAGLALDLRGGATSKQPV